MTYGATCRIDHEPDAFCYDQATEQQRKTFAALYSHAFHWALGKADPEHDESPERYATAYAGRHWDSPDDEWPNHSERLAIEYGAPLTDHAMWDSVEARMIKINDIVDGHDDDVWRVAGIVPSTLQGRPAVEFRTDGGTVTARLITVKRRRVQAVGR